MNNFLKICKEYIPYIAVIIIIILIKAYVITPVIVSGPSMLSTLHDGDIMLLNKLYKEKDIERFDIVVVKYEKKNIIKRVIGLPGDTIECIDNKLYVNGKVIVEKYLDDKTVTDDFNLKDSFGIDKVPEGHYFVMGDNREVSLDSRKIGPVKASDIDGEAFFTLFPFNRFGSSN